MEMISLKGANKLNLLLFSSGNNNNNNNNNLGFIEYGIRWRRRNDNSILQRCLCLKPHRLENKNTKKKNKKKHEKPFKACSRQQMLDYHRIFVSKASCLKTAFTKIMTNNYNYNNNQLGVDLTSCRRRNKALLTDLLSSMDRDATKMFAKIPACDLVPWITMMGTMLQLGLYVGRKRTYPNLVWGAVTFAILIMAAVSLELVFEGRQLHACAMKMGLHDHNLVSAALIAMYAKFGTLKDAKNIFHAMPITEQDNNATAWNNMIAAYSFHGYDEEALTFFYRMKLESHALMDSSTVLVILVIYSRLGYLGHTYGELIHLASHCPSHQTCKYVHGFLFLGPSFTDYWNALIDGYGNHGQGDMAIEFLQELFRYDITLKTLNLHVVLSACSKSGLSQLGLNIFNRMTMDHEIELDGIHFAYMIELLGRERLLAEAFKLLCSAPFKPTVDMWAVLLTACRFNKDLKLGKLAAEELYKLEPQKQCYYMVLINIYESWGMLNEPEHHIIKRVNGVLRTLERKGLIRILLPSSSIEIQKNTSHVFFAGDKQANEIYQKVDDLMQEVSSLGHVDGGKVTLLPDVDEKQQSRIGKYHSEKLAIAFGLIQTGDNRITLRIVQEHRVCEDCHDAIKLIAVATRRKIVLKDAGRFHIFQDGECSCGDYW